MAPRGRKKAGLMRDDAARDAMRAFGFEKRVIKVCIKELLEVYGEDGWFLIEDCGYQVLLNKCLEKQDELPKKSVEEEKEEMAEEQNEEKHDLSSVLREQEQQVEDRRDHVGSNSTSLVGCDAETGAQADALSITSETVIMDSSPAAIQSGEASADYASPAVIQSGYASADYAHHSVAGSRSSQCGWLSEEEEEEETDPNEHSDVDDGEMIQLTPEPLCEELEDLLRKVRGEKKRKRPTRWDL